MIRLNLPHYPFRIKSKENKLYIFDRNRKKEIVLTDEEWVRQHFVEYLVNEKKYPRSLIAIEKQCTVENMTKRTDIIVFDRTGQVNIIVECKAPKIRIQQDTFDQIARYNLKLKANFLIVTNGLEHFYCQMDHKEQEYRFLNDIPDYG
jgi:hypothetical protein